MSGFPLLLFGTYLAKGFSTSPKEISPIYSPAEARALEGKQIIKKVVHFVRHAEGHHNVAGRQNYENYLKEDYADSAITEIGKIQCENLCKKTQTYNKIIWDADLVVVSPLRRALETACLSFPFLLPTSSRPIKWIALEEVRYPIVLSFFFHRRIHLNPLSINGLGKQQENILAIDEIRYIQPRLYSHMLTFPR